MTRINVRMYLAAASVAGVFMVCVAGGVLWALQPKQPSLDDLLHLSPIETDTRLFTGARDATTQQALSPYDSAVDFLAADKLTRIRTLLKYKDGSSEDIVWLAGGPGRVSSQKYYPVQSGETARRLEILDIFADDGTTVKDETVRWLSGRLKQHSEVLADGRKHIVDFAQDGVTYVGERFFAKKECCSDPKLISEKRWLSDADHTLSFEDNLLETGGRKRIWYGAMHLPLKVVTLPDDNSTNGAKAIVYYPGTTKVRLTAESDYTSTKVTYLREDGTREMAQTLTYSWLNIDYFDAAGTTRLRTLSFWRVVTVKGGVESVSYSPYQLTTFNGPSDDDEVERWYYYQNKLKSYRINHVTEGGVTYTLVEYRYDDNEKLEKVVYFGASQKIQDIVKEVLPEPGTNNPPHYAPPIFTEQPVVEDGLPIPPPQTGEHGM
jgi:hypothetical protein